MIGSPRHVDSEIDATKNVTHLQNNEPRLTFQAMARLICLFIALLCLIAGCVFVRLSLSLPVYHDENAPGELSQEILDMKLSREARFEKWHEMLPTLETNHKRFSDWGRGLISAAVGLVGSLVFFTLYRRYRNLRRLRTILVVWILLWLMKLPFVLWYYGLRLERFDYPVWGDSIAIPVFSEGIAYLILAAVSTVVLRFVSIDHPPKKRLAWHKPKSVWGWSRLIILLLWLILNIWVITSAIKDGDEGTVIFCTVGSAILLAFLMTKEKKPAVPVKDERFPVVDA